MRRLSGRLVPLLLAAVLLQACGREPEPTGSWVLWSVNDTPPAEAQPVRRALQVDDAELWSERTLANLEIRIMAGGDYRALRTEHVAISASRDAYRRLTGETWSGAEPARRDRLATTRETIGRWELRGGSVVFRHSEEQMRVHAAEVLRSVNPRLSDEAIAARLDTMFRLNRPAPEYEGTFDGSRLLLRDASGRRLVLHRGEPAPAPEPTAQP